MKPNGKWQKYILKRDSERERGYGLLVGYWQLETETVEKPRWICCSVPAMHIRNCRINSVAGSLPTANRIVAKCLPIDLFPRHQIRFLETEAGRGKVRYGKNKNNNWTLASAVC